MPCSKSQQHIQAHLVYSYTQCQTKNQKSLNFPDYEVTNENDSKAMGNMVRRAKAILGKNDFSVLFDKGYHKGKELDAVHKMGVKTFVAIPGIPKTSQAPNPA
jgi:hypothetical protein